MTHKGCHWCRHQALSCLVSISSPLTARSPRLSIASEKFITFIIFIKFITFAIFAAFTPVAPFALFAASAGIRVPSGNRSVAADECCRFG